MDLNSRVVTNVDRQTYGQTNRRKAGSLYRAMLEAGATINDETGLTLTHFMTRSKGGLHKKVFWPPTK